MRFPIILLLLSLVSSIAHCADAPKNAVYGREVLGTGEHLLISFSVHTRILILEGNLDKALILKTQSLPIYPNEALHSGVVGETVITFKITKEGIVEGIEVVKSTHKEFAESSVGSVSRWCFSPPVYQGKPTQIVVQATFLFSMFDAQEK